MDLKPLESNSLRVVISIENGVAARGVATVLSSLDKAFSRYVQAEYGRRGARLQIVETGVGSWWAILMACKEVYDLSQDHPDLIPVFVNNVDATYRILTTQEPKDTAKHLRDLVQDLARAGQRLGADAIDLISIARVTITAAQYDLILRPDNDRTKQSRTSRLPATAQAAFPPERHVLEHAAELSGAGQLVGTVFSVDGTWYARAEGMFGVLLPLDLSHLVAGGVRHGVTYVIDGFLSHSSEGHPIAIAVRKLSEL